MCLHGAFADNEGFGDFGVGVSSGDEPEDLLFATCERCEPGQFWCRARFGKDRLRCAFWSVQPSIRTAWRWVEVFRNRWDRFRPRREHETCPRGVQGRSGVHEVYFYQDDHEADRHQSKAFGPCVDFMGQPPGLELEVGDGQ